MLKKYFSGCFGIVHLYAQLLKQFSNKFTLNYYNNCSPQIQILVKIMIDEISINKPGSKVQLDPDLLKELSSLSPKFKKQLTFFGGHPVSMTKKDENTVFNILNKNRQSPYLVCQKTDGVRYILIVTNEGCYFVSRQGSKSIVAYSAPVQVSQNWQYNPSSIPKKSQFEKIIHILDGQMIRDVINEKEYFKYLIFDALVIFNQNIIEEKLIDRLKKVQRFMTCNRMLLDYETEIKKQTIELHVKDFFRLTCASYVSSEVMRRQNMSEQPSTVEFLLKYYIKCLPHENDGLIFNHEEKPYQLGVNNGYLKWKPSHLNTVDFFLIPNTKLIPRFGRRILDLYCGAQDKEITSQEFNQNVYRLCFYNFTIVDENQFDLLEQTINEKMNNDTGEDEMVVGLIAECKYQPISNQQRKIFKQLISSTKDHEEIYIDTMKKHNFEMETQVIKKLQSSPYMNYWKIFRIRSDKSTPNYNTIVSKIEQSIKDDIKIETLITKNRQLNQKSRMPY